MSSYVGGGVCLNRRGLQQTALITSHTPAQPFAFAFGWGRGVEGVAMGRWGELLLLLLLPPS